VHEKGDRVGEREKEAIPFGFIIRELSGAVVYKPTPPLYTILLSSVLYIVW
jgi:hypothetical protein